MNIKKPNNCLNCKAKAELVRFGGGLYQCRCTGCGSLGRLTPYKSDAVKYWNEEHRPEPETLPESIAYVSVSAELYADYERLKAAAQKVIIEADAEGSVYCMSEVAMMSEGLVAALGELQQVINGGQNG